MGDRRRGFGGVDGWMCEWEGGAVDLLLLRKLTAEEHSIVEAFICRQLRRCGYCLLTPGSSLWMKQQCLGVRAAHDCNDDFMFFLADVQSSFGGCGPEPCVALTLSMLLY
jgi:hypothetical protein